MEMDIIMVVVNSFTEYCQEIVKAFGSWACQRAPRNAMLLASENVGITLELPPPNRIEVVQRLPG